MEVLKPKVKKVKEYEERTNKKTKYLVKINTNLRLQDLEVLLRTQEQGDDAIASVDLKVNKLLFDSNDPFS